MREGGPSAKTRGHHAAVDLAFGVALLVRRVDLEERVIEQISRRLDQLDLAGRSMLATGVGFGGFVITGAAPAS